MVTKRISFIGIIAIVVVMIMSAFAAFTVASDSVSAKSKPHAPNIGKARSGNSIVVMGSNPSACPQWWQFEYANNKSLKGKKVKKIKSNSLYATMKFKKTGKTQYVRVRYGGSKIGTSKWSKTIKTK